MNNAAIFSRDIELASLCILSNLILILIMRLLHRHYGHRLSFLLLFPNVITIKALILLINFDVLFMLILLKAISDFRFVVAKLLIIEAQNSGC